MGVICAGGGGIGGSTHELVRADHVFVCLWEQSTCIKLVVDYYGLTNDTVLLIPSV